MVVILGSYDLPEYRYAVLQSGADYFLSRDVLLDGVFNLVKEIILNEVCVRLIFKTVAFNNSLVARFIILWLYCHSYPTW